MAWLNSWLVTHRNYPQFDPQWQQKFFLLKWTKKKLFLWFKEKIHVQEVVSLNSCHRILLHGYFFTFICCKIVLLLFEKNENKQKGPFKKKKMETIKRKDGNTNKWFHFKKKENMLPFFSSWVDYFTSGNE